VNKSLVEEGTLEVCQMLLNQEPGIINKKNSAGFTPLMLACEAGQTACVKLLLEQGADVNLSTKTGTMAIHKACSAEKNSADMIRLLLPLANTDQLYAACLPPAFKSAYPLAGSMPPQLTLSPFHLAIDRENWDSRPCHQAGLVALQNAAEGMPCPQWFLPLLLGG